MVIVEDDGLQYSRLQKYLLEEFPGTELMRIRTARAFQESIPGLGKAPPDIILIDVMVAWQSKSEASTSDKPLPPEVKEADYKTIGIYLPQWLARNEKTRSIPLILYSELDRARIAEKLPSYPSHVRYLRKTNDYSRLSRHIRQMIQTSSFSDRWSHRPL